MTNLRLVEPGWYVARCQCRNCGKVDLSVFPVNADATALECAKCGQMTSEARWYYGPEHTDDVLRPEQEATMEQIEIPFPNISPRAIWVPIDGSYDIVHTHVTDGVDKITSKLMVNGVERKYRTTILTDDMTDA